MQLHAEVAVAQLSKVGEELCGDRVEVSRAGTVTTVVLSDGLGSGVKANILATLTTKIASSMLKRGIPLEEVVNTVAQTLPVCRDRKIAYSTLHIIKLLPDGETKVVEFDSPAAFLIRGGKVVPFPTREKLIAGKTIKEGSLSLQEDDFIVAVSDGVVHAGIGGLLKLGWNWQGISAQLTAAGTYGASAQDVANEIINCCNGYYVGKPGDDSTVVAIKLRQPRHLTLLAGPPANQADDERVVKEFRRKPGKKVVAGGTTANIVGRITGSPVVVDLSYHDPDVPPRAHIKGVDLVTEGILTLNTVIDRFGNAKMLGNATYQDGATMMARLLLEADKISILAGTAINPAHQNPNFPTRINIKVQVLTNLKTRLESFGKEVNIDWF